MKTILIAVTTLLWVSAANADNHVLLFAKTYMPENTPVSNCIKASQSGLKVVEALVDYTHIQRWLWNNKLFELQYAPMVVQRVQCKVYNPQ